MTVTERTIGKWLRNLKLTRLQPCPARDVGAAVIPPAGSTEGMNGHLEGIASQVSPAAHAIVVCDGAGWHQGARGLNYTKRRKH